MIVIRIVEYASANGFSAITCDRQICTPLPLRQLLILDAISHAVT